MNNNFLNEAKEPTMPLRVMLDNGIIGHSEFAADAIKEVPGQWGDTPTVSQVHGLMRKFPDNNIEQQKQIDALFTIGRMIREGRIEAYIYSEINCERIRGSVAASAFNALKGCEIRSCPPALERSNYRATSNFEDAISKGGKKDRKSGLPLGQANQIAFFKWLCSLEPNHVRCLLSYKESIRMSEFEKESWENIQLFQALCLRSGTETYPDFFHLWTAERNDLDGFLTLDKTLFNIAIAIGNEKKAELKLRTKVFRPLDLLQRFGINEPDPVPMDLDIFYNFI